MAKVNWAKFSVRDLFRRLAGDKYEACDAYAENLYRFGYQQERAWAEALEAFKCPNTFPDKVVTHG